MRTHSTNKPAKYVALAVMMIVSGAFLVISCRSAEPLVPYRAWQFHKLEMPYVSKVLKRAKDYDINTVVYSHGMIGEVSQLYDGTERGEQLRQLAAEAHELGLRVWIWIHELEYDVPERYLEGGVVHLDRPGLWDWLAAKYDRLFKDYPEFDGIILTFHETEYKIFRESEVQSSLSMPERFARMINTIDDVCAKYDKDFVVRSFLYEPKELQWFEEGIKQVHKRVMLQSKCVPHDWQPYYPHNPVIGKFPNRQLIVEFDCSSEFTGKSYIPHTSPEYFEHRWRYDLSQPGVVGYNARIDHGGYDALYTPNEINIYTLYRLTEDRRVDADDIWPEWTRLRYGEAGAATIEKVLRPTFKVVNKAYFPLKFWITNHSKLPSFRYADGHISSRTLAKWIPEEPAYKEMEERLNHPDPELLEMILAEKDSAIAIAEDALRQLEAAKSLITPAQYEDLQRRLELLRRTTLIWKAHAEAFFGYKILAEGHEAPGLKKRIEKAFEALYEQAEISEGDPWVRTLQPGPGSPEIIREVTDELKMLLENLQ